MIWRRSMQLTQPGRDDQSRRRLRVLAHSAGQHGDGRRRPASRRHTDHDGRQERDDAGDSTNFRIIAINGTSGGALTLNGVTEYTSNHVSGMMETGAGGGILNLSGTLTWTAPSSPAASRPTPLEGDRQRLWRDRHAEQERSRAWNAVSGDGQQRGGILGLASSLTLNNDTVDRRTTSGGGGIRQSGNGNGGGPGSSITLNKSVISNNTATAPAAGGGGISNGGTLVSNNSQIIGNTAPGATGAGLLNHVTATLNKTVVSGNSAPRGLGGGITNAIFFAGQPTPTLVLNNSQVTGNSADAGGGIVNISFDPIVSAGTVTLRHSDVSGNTPDNCEPPGSISGCTG